MSVKVMQKLPFLSKKDNGRSRFWWFSRVRLAPWLKSWAYAVLPIFIDQKMGKALSKKRSVSLKKLQETPWMQSDTKSQSPARGTPCKRRKKHTCVWLQETESNMEAF